MLDRDSMREMGGASLPGGSLRIRADSDDTIQFVAGTCPLQNTLDGFYRCSGKILDVFITDTARITIDGVSEST